VDNEPALKRMRSGPAPEAGEAKTALAFEARKGETALPREAGEGKAAMAPEAGSEQAASAAPQNGSETGSGNGYACTPPLADVPQKGERMPMHMHD
jgi:hypothetical protein